MPSILPHIEALSKASATGEPFAVITMIDARGSTPQDAGTKMIVNAQGLVHGTVGGGDVEQKSIERAQAMIASDDKDRELIEWNLQTDLGMTCGGLVTLLIEVFNRNDWHIFVFGAGHVAQSLVRALISLDCRVTCTDSRQEWLDRFPQSPKLKTICSEDWAATAGTVRPKDHVICMTMNHDTDATVISTIKQGEIRPAYLGTIGSKTKRAAVLRQLKADGVEATEAEDFFCPVGLKLGSNQPAEIAISVVAQLLQIRDEK